MKVTAFLMLVCLAFLMVFPTGAKPMHTVAVKNCCHGTEKQQPCHPQQNDDCGQGMCNVMLCCPTCCFFTVDPIVVKPLIPTVKELQVIPYHMGNLSGYSLINWNPPKV
ncbi:hypothetical protein HDF24_05205 [Mucilaginibacter sp. X4EP1]|uniref:hypothetical protein n=1 Tax=Mucilaginibacter sp. X4EP1 TaxID=2723092 RepID=UPI002169C6D1|nr:hypothetical protein [Mucilaginibacter sp. X4EP1]MCS3814512.1 hypothetical protein [Mucilaginibacter sp. X4EP1]